MHNLIARVPCLIQRLRGEKGRHLPDMRPRPRFARRRLRLLAAVPVLSSARLSHVDCQGFRLQLIRSLSSEHTVKLTVYSRVNVQSEERGCRHDSPIFPDIIHQIDDPTIHLVRRMPKTTADLFLRSYSTGQTLEQRQLAIWLNRFRERVGRAMMMQSI